MINMKAKCHRILELVVVIGVLVASNVAFSQTNQDTTTRLDYFNLDGEFVYRGGLYVDSAGLLYGIVDEKRCQWYTAKVIGKRAIVKDRPIAMFKTEGNVVTLNYPTSFVVHVKLKRASFESFLKENTVNGDLVEPVDLRVKGKQLKIYTQIGFSAKQKYTLSNRYRGE
jgi:hypothetical protein